MSAALLAFSQSDSGNDDNRPAGHRILLPHEIGPAAEVIRIGAALSSFNTPSQYAVARRAEASARPGRRVAVADRGTRGRKSPRFGRLVRRWAASCELNRVEAAVGKKLQAARRATRSRAAETRGHRPAACRPAGESSPLGAP